MQEQITTIEQVPAIVSLGRGTGKAIAQEFAREGTIVTVTGGR